MQQEEQIENLREIIQVNYAEKTKKFFFKMISTHILNI